MFRPVAGRPTTESQILARNARLVLENGRHLADAAQLAAAGKIYLLDCLAGEHGDVSEMCQAIGAIDGLIERGILKRLTIAGVCAAIAGSVLELDSTEMPAWAHYWRARWFVSHSKKACETLLDLVIREAATDRQASVKAYAIALVEDTAKHFPDFAPAMMAAAPAVKARRQSEFGDHPQLPA